MKRTIITSVITTLVVNLLIHSSGFAVWIACGLLACVISNKFDSCPTKLKWNVPFAWGLTAAGPISLLITVCLFWRELKTFIPFKFQSPITKIKTDVTAE